MGNTPGPQKSDVMSGGHVFSSWGVGVDTIELSNGSNGKTEE